MSQLIAGARSAGSKESHEQTRIGPRHAANRGDVPIDVLVAMAERELTTFARAVNELFGPEQASLSVNECATPSLLAIGSLISSISNTSVRHDG